VILSPGQVSIFPGQTIQLNALVTDDRGQLLPGRPVTYSSDTPQFATVSGTGLVTGVATGVATITATSEGASGTASVTVMPEPVALVQVTPATASVTVGQAVQFNAVPFNSSGKVLTGRAIAWSSASPGVASVSSLGTATGIAQGTAVIVASIDGTQGSAVVTVRPVPVASVTVTPPAASAAVGQTISLTATLRDANGNFLSGRVVGWTSSDNAIATVSGTGVVTGVAVGSVTITATSEGQTGSSSVSIAAVAVASVSVSPPTASVDVGQTTQFAATARDATGKVLTGRIVNWSSGTPGVATVSTSGLVTGVSPGSATITATVDGVPGTASVTVTQVPVASVTVAPSTATTSIGQTVPLTATTRDAGGNILTGRVVTWTTSAAGTATVSTNGVVTGVSAGTATITATSEGQSASATITVNGPPVATTITVSPSTNNVIINTTATLAATVRDQFGNVMPGAIVTWSSSDAAVASVSTAGVVTGVALGSATISASSGTLSGTASVTVVPVPVDRIVVTPADVTVNPGQVVQYVATLYDANNNVLTGRTVTWSSSRPTRVSINSSTGLAFAIRDVGTAIITASSGGKTGTATIHVN
jgi:uncharacterized protein YjdB